MIRAFRRRRSRQLLNLSGRCRATGVADGVRPIRADHGRTPQRGQEVLRAVEIGHLQVRRTDALRVVRVRAFATWQVAASGEQRCLPVKVLVLAFGSQIRAPDLFGPLWARRSRAAVIVGSWSASARSRLKANRSPIVPAAMGRFSMSSVAGLRKTSWTSVTR